MLVGVSEGIVTVGTKNINASPALAYAYPVGVKGPAAWGYGEGHHGVSHVREPEGSDGGYYANR